MYQECQTNAQQAECVASLASCCESLRRRLGYSDQDARSVVLNNMRSIAHSCQMVLNLLDSWAIGDETVRTAIPQLLGMRDITDRSVRSAGDILHKTSKLSLALLGQFQIENCSRSLARELHVEAERQGFYPLAEALLQELGIARDCLGVLNVVALIRNSLHTNGIHYGYQGHDTVTVVEDATYEFRHEERVQCATTEHIAHALEASVGVLEEVFPQRESDGAARPDYGPVCMGVSDGTCESRRLTQIGS